jgi:type VI secretion system protein ImpA
LNWYQFRESRAVGSEEAADTEEKQLARREAIAEGKVTQEQFDKDFDAAPKSFYVNLESAFDNTLESLSLLGEACDAKFGDVSPSFGTLRAVLEEVRQAAHSLLQRKREKEPDAPVGEPAAEIEQVEEVPLEVEVAAPVAATGAAVRPAAAARRGALTAEPVDRDDAVLRVVTAAKFLRQADQYSPAPYLLLRGLRWGELRTGGDTINETLLSPPPTEIRQKLKSLALEYNWTEVLETAETAMGLECGRGWLDVQRYASRACLEMGSYYDPIRTAIISGLRALLADYPQLPEMTMMDDTPTANAETRSWIEEQVSPPAAAPATAAPEPVPEPWAYPVQDSPAEEAATVQAPDTYDLAMQAARSGRPQEGIELLMRELGQERSGRGRFHRKVQLSQLCVSMSHENIALPILQELAAEIERRKLEDWEAPDVVARPLALLYQCLGKGDDELRAKLYSWICRLDPLMALNVSR